MQRSKRTRRKLPKSKPEKRRQNSLRILSTACPSCAAKTRYVLWPTAINDHGDSPTLLHSDSSRIFQRGRNESPPSASGVSSIFPGPDAYRDEEDEQRPEKRHKAGDGKGKGKGPIELNGINIKESIANSLQPWYMGGPKPDAAKTVETKEPEITRPARPRVSPVFF